MNTPGIQSCSLLFTTLCPVLTDEISSELTILECNSSSVPKWSETAQNVFVLQPSSGGAERVFSVLNNSFWKRQLRTLEDYVEASVMLQYNKRSYSSLLYLHMNFVIVHAH